MKNAWSFSAQLSGAVLELSIYDIVDPNAYSDSFFGSYGVSARQVLDRLAAAQDVQQINVRINSAGGDVFDGMAIYNLLHSHPAKVRVQVDGLCASIASIIAMAGDEIVMGEGTWMMIHKPYAAYVSSTGADDLRATADVLDKMTESMCAVYAARTGQKPAAIEKAMAAETWMTAEDALSLGYCTKVTPANAPVETETTEQVKAVASALLKNFARVPAGAFVAMARAHGDRMQILANATKPAEESTLAKELEAAKAALKISEGEKGALEAALAELKKAPAPAPAPAAAPEGVEAAALTRLGATARALTGSKTMAEAEAAIVALAAKNDKLERLESEVAVLGKERHQARVSQLIAEGKLKPSRKEYFVNASAADLDQYLLATGGEVLAPVGHEHSQPPVVELVDGKGVINALDREAGKLLGLTEVEMQQAADLRAQKFGK